MIDPAELDSLAAEYVLGTLDERERFELSRLRRSDPALDAEIRAWEGRFGPLSEATVEEMPPRAVRAAILDRIHAATRSARVDPDAGRRSADIIQLRRQKRVWQGVAAVAAALAAVLGIWVARVSLLPTAQNAGTYVAVLQQGPDQPSFVVSVDVEHRRMTVIPASTQAQAGKSYELWMIQSDQTAPLSLGLLDPKSPAHPRLPDDDAGQITHATYAVTLEPAGGSPTGQPTSKPIFVGRLLSAPL